ncbi:unnamed protein product [Candida verbasci]|uniref:Defective in cullin neddylation protein n=1 Tax=Candida verbasci TaxID=1227364 RepID=A0A9W4TXL5_9ASCO|nr:unnamed protein product [Candida verbasci]
MVNKAQLKTQFIELTQVSNTTATKYLENAKYDLGTAIDKYFSKHPNNHHKSETIIKIPHDSKLIKLFDKYKSDEKNDIIDIDGTISYLEDLNIQPEDFKALIIAFLLKSPKMGVFNKSNFIGIWSNLNINNLEGMKSYINKYESSILMTNFDTFKKIYQFAFKFSVELENQKLLEIETCIDYWNLLIPKILKIEEVNTDLDEGKINERVEQWYTFLKEYEKKSLTFDSWSMFYSFLIEIIFKDPEGFNDYDEMAAWPSIIDEYIEYLHDNKLLN